MRSSHTTSYHSSCTSRMPSRSFSGSTVVQLSFDREVRLTPSHLHGSSRRALPTSNDLPCPSLRRLVNRSIFTWPNHPFHQAQDFERQDMSLVHARAASNLELSHLMSFFLCGSKIKPGNRKKSLGVHQIVSSSESHSGPAKLAWGNVTIMLRQAPYGVGTAIKLRGR